MSVFYGDKIRANDAFRGAREVRALTMVGACVMVCSEDEFIGLDQERAEQGIGVFAKDIISVNGNKVHNDWR